MPTWNRVRPYVEGLALLGGAWAAVELLREKLAAAPSVPPSLDVPMGLPALPSRIETAIFGNFFGTV